MVVDVVIGTITAKAAHYCVEPSFTEQETITLRVCETISFQDIQVPIAPHLNNETKWVPKYKLRTFVRFKSFILDQSQQRSV